MNTKLSPPSYSLSSQKLQWILDPVKYMDQAFAECGDTFMISQNAQDPCVIVSHPEAMKKILTDPSLDQSSNLTQLFLPLLGENSLFLLSGSKHKRQRKLLMPPFHGERMFSYGKLISQITEKISSKLTLNKPFPIMTMTKEISMSVILQAVFGIYKQERYQKIKQLIGNRLKLTGSPLGYILLNFPILQQDLGAWSPWGRITHTVRKIDQLLYAEIRERRSQPDPERIDILNLLLMARDEQGQLMTDRELRDQLMTLLSAGNSTTATALAWALYWIHKLPQVKEKLLTELASLEENPDPMTIVRLPYLSAVCNETLRIYPSLMHTFPRVVNSPLEIRDYHFEPGTSILGSIYLTHQRQELYPQPKQFKPERFLNKQFSPYEFIPYGGGTRRCIGSALAEFEMKLVLAKIMTTLKLTLIDTKVQPKRRGVALLAPSTGVKMVVEA